MPATASKGPSPRDSPAQLELIDFLATSGGLIAAASSLALAAQDAAYLPAAAAFNRAMQRDADIPVTIGARPSIQGSLDPGDQGFGEFGRIADQIEELARDLAQRLGLPPRVMLAHLIIGERARCGLGFD